MKEIPKAQIIRRLKLENFWWLKSNKLSQAYSQWNPRAYLKLFYPLVENHSIRRAVVLMGPRRVGKTVMLHHAIQELIKNNTNPMRICYFSVDHPIYTGLSLEQLLDYFEEATETQYLKEECYIFFDEIQYLKNWELHLKALVDRFFNIKCIVSGSAAAALKLKSSESGAGRFTNFLLPPLTFHEYLKLLKIDKIMVSNKNETKTDDIESLNKYFLNYLNFGGYPEVIFSDEIQSDSGRYVKNDIVDKVLLRDLPSLYGVQDIQELNYLFTTLAFNSANEVSLEELSKKSGVAKNTIKKYIEYLEAAFLVRVVHRIDRNAKRFKRANFFKVYLTNPSIRCALFSPVNFDDQAIGNLAETATFSQWFHSDVLLHYGRWKNGEIDMVYLDNRQNVEWAVEVKLTDRFFDRPHELKNVVQFCHANNLPNVTVTTLTKQGTKIIENVKIEFIPTSMYCYTVGYNIIAGKKMPIHS